MTRDEMQSTVASLLAEQVALRRFNLSLPPDKLMLLKRLLQRLGWTGGPERMSRQQSPKKYSTREHLQQAINENPNDSTGFGVMADYLDENGLPGGAIYRAHMQHLAEKDRPRVWEGARLHVRAGLPVGSQFQIYTRARQAMRGIEPVILIYHPGGGPDSPPLRVAVNPENVDAIANDVHNLGYSSTAKTLRRHVERQYPKKMARLPRRYSLSHTHADFVRKIMENPKEATAPLVYADWLEENGMPTVAQIIRHHIKRSGGKAGPHVVIGVGAIEHYFSRKYPYQPVARIERHSTPDGNQFLVYVSHHLPNEGAKTGPWFYHSIVANGPEEASHLMRSLEKEGVANAKNSRLAFNKATGEKFSRLPRRVLRYAASELTPDEKARARKVDLVILPEGIEGTNCGSCRYVSADKSKCDHPEVRLPVNDRHCCALWDAKGTTHVGGPVAVEKPVKEQRKYAKAEKERDKAHPLVAGFPIEHALRHLANDPKNSDAIRDLAKTALTGGKNKDGTPTSLWLLHDALMDESHPMLHAYNWMSAADKVGLDAKTYQALSEAAEDARRRQPAPHHVPNDPNVLQWRFLPEHQAVLASFGSYEKGVAPEVKRFNRPVYQRIRDRVRQLHPEVTDKQIEESLKRHVYRAGQVHRERNNTPSDTYQQRALVHPNDNPVKSADHDEEVATRYRRKFAKRRPKMGYDDFVRHLAANPNDETAALVLADWFDDHDMPTTAAHIRKYVNSFSESDPDDFVNRREFRVGIANATGRKENKGPWVSRFYVYAPQAVHKMGGDPYTATTLHLRHPDDKTKSIYFTTWGSEQEGSNNLIGFQKEGHEPYHPNGTDHEAFRAARPELFMHTVDQAHAAHAERLRRKIVKMKINGQPRKYNELVKAENHLAGIPTPPGFDPKGHSIPDVLDAIHHWHARMIVAYRQLANEFSQQGKNYHAKKAMEFEDEHNLYKHKTRAAMHRVGRPWPEWAKENNGDPVPTDSDYDLAMNMIGSVTKRQPKPRPTQVQPKQIAESPRSITSDKLKRKYALVNSRGDYIDALRRSRSKQMQKLRRTTESLAQRLGVAPVKTYASLHDSPQGATPGIVSAVYGDYRPEDVHALAAWQALSGNLPGIGVIHIRPNGPDLIHQMKLGGSELAIRMKLAKAGINNRVVISHHSGSNVLIPDPGGKLAKQVYAYAKANRTAVQTSPGFLKVIGDADRARSRELFRNTIVKQEGA